LSSFIAFPQGSPRASQAPPRPSCPSPPVWPTLSKIQVGASNVAVHAVSKCPDQRNQIQTSTPIYTTHGVSVFRGRRGCRSMRAYWNGAIAHRPSTFYAWPPSLWSCTHACLPVPSDGMLTVTKSKETLVHHVSSQFRMRRQKPTHTRTHVHTQIANHKHVSLHTNINACCTRTQITHASSQVLRRRRPCQLPLLSKWTLSRTSYMTVRCVSIVGCVCLRLGFRAFENLRTGGASDTAIGET
jgi:hypothetical protein